MLYKAEFKISKTFNKPGCFIGKTSIMENKNQKDKTENKAEKAASSKEQASFDQNGEGASEKFGQAGETPNESGEQSPGTVNSDKKK